jgi:NADPH:quinone reductase-like Zn-dependent oxidoreductase
MNAAVLHALGETPQLEQFPEPQIADGETLVRVSAASLKPIDHQIAAGTHYASPRQLPFICGLDGVGHLDSGSRVFFAAPRRPYGAMAPSAPVRTPLCWPLPENIDDVTAAAIVNPGMSAWLSLSTRANLAAGESVLILGATGTTGKLAIQIAKLLGASRVVAAGRHAETLAKLPSLGADATIPLSQSAADLTAAFIQHASPSGFDVILDYLWGGPTEAFLAAITRSDFSPAPPKRPRLIQVGESAGSTISLPAAALRSSGLEILGSGTGAIPSMDILRSTFDQLLAHAASGRLRIDTITEPLSNVAAVWNRPDPLHRRVVFIP